MSDHLCKAPETIADYSCFDELYKGDHLSTPETAKKPELGIEEKTQKNDVHVITSLYNSQEDCPVSVVDCKEADLPRRSQGDHEAIAADSDRQKTLMKAYFPHQLAKV